MREEARSVNLQRMDRQAVQWPVTDEQENVALTHMPAERPHDHVANLEPALTDVAVLTKSHDLALKRGKRAVQPLHISRTALEYDAVGTAACDESEQLVSSEEV